MPDQSRPIVFVSHAAVDAEIAAIFKADVEQHFLGLCRLFVSSSLDSLTAGEEWTATIKKHLNEAVILIGLLSPIAIQRGWVYFEFGAAWMRGIPVIPVCHSGLIKDSLPPPLSIFQGLNLSDQCHLEHLYGKIATSVNCEKPQINFAELANKYHVKTESGRENLLITQWTQQIVSLNPEFKALLEARTESSEILIPAHLEPEFLEFKQAAESRRVFNVTPRGVAMGTRVDAVASVFIVSRGENFSR